MGGWSVFPIRQAGWQRTRRPGGQLVNCFRQPWTSRPVLLVGLGDSVTAGFGARKGYSYFDRLAKNPADEFPEINGICLAAIFPKFAINQPVRFGQHICPKFQPDNSIPCPQTRRSVLGIVVMTTGGNDIIHNYGQDATARRSHVWRDLGRGKTVGGKFSAAAGFHAGVNGHPRRLTFFHSDFQTLADRILSRPIALGEGSVDNRHQQRIGTVRGSEGAPTQQRDACSRKVIARHMRGPGEIQVNALRRNVTLRNECVATVPSAVGQQVGNTHCLHARQLFEPAQHCCVERIYRNL